MGKLYKQTRSGIPYREPWTFGNKIIVHEGKLG